MRSNILAPDKIALKKAVKSLHEGNIIGLPTETVYGIAVDARNDDAVLKLYDLKERDHAKPLQVMVGSMKAAEALVHFNAKAKKIGDAFFPGPITLILQKKEGSHISPLVCLRNDTFGIRIPNHPTTLEVLREFGGPIVISSANISGETPPVNVDEIPNALYNNLDLVIDGGPCSIGISSTVIDMTGEFPVILREGVVTKADLEQVLNTL